MKKYDTKDRLENVRQHKLGLEDMPKWKEDT